MPMFMDRDWSGESLEKFFNPGPVCSPPKFPSSSFSTSTYTDFLIRKARVEVQQNLLSVGVGRADLQEVRGISVPTHR